MQFISLKNLCFRHTTLQNVFLRICSCRLYRRTSEISTQKFLARFILYATMKYSRFLPPICTDCYQRFAAYLTLNVYLRTTQRTDYFLPFRRKGIASGEVHVIMHIREMMYKFMYRYLNLTKSIPYAIIAS